MHRGVTFAVLVALAACGKDEPSAVKAAPGSSSAAPAAPALPDACNAWKDAMTRFAACAKIPADVRGAIGAAFAATAARWPALVSADRDALGDACVTGLDGIRAQLGAAGCR